MAQTSEVQVRIATTLAVVVLAVMIQCGVGFALMELSRQYSPGEITVIGQIGVGLLPLPWLNGGIGLFLVPITAVALALCWRAFRSSRTSAEGSPRAI